MVAEGFGFEDVGLVLGEDGPDMGELFGVVASVEVGGDAGLVGVLTDALVLFAFDRIEEWFGFVASCGFHVPVGVGAFDGVAEDDDEFHRGVVGVDALDAVVPVHVDGGGFAEECLGGGWFEVGVVVGVVWLVGFGL